MRTDNPRAQTVLGRIRDIPPGFVRAYGDVSPGAPRFAGALLASAHHRHVPWWRVVRADGSLAKGTRQRQRLEAEGVPFRGRRVDMAVARLPADLFAGYEAETGRSLSSDAMPASG